jgi:hypothetical protein
VVEGVDRRLRVWLPQRQSRAHRSSLESQPLCIAEELLAVPLICSSPATFLAEALAVFELKKKNK